MPAIGRVQAACGRSTAVTIVLVDVPQKPKPLDQEFDAVRVEGFTAP